MAMPRLHMRQIREILRLKFEGRLSNRQIADSVGCCATSVFDCLNRHAATGLGWPMAEGLTDGELEARLYYTSQGRPSHNKAMPNWSLVHQELRKKSVTTQLVWMEYKSANPDGYQYTQFCHYYRQWKKTVDLPFRNEHRAGERVFVDYAGQTMPIYDAGDGSVRQAQIFIGVLGASNYTFCEATWTQTLPDWIDSHRRMFAFFGGVPEIWVPDNLKSGVTSPCRYDPLINPTYYSMSKHYGAAVIPARKRRPKDKAKVEVGVQIVERWVLAALRNRKFFSLDELNAAIRELLESLNSRPFKKLEGCRQKAFDAIDRPALKLLPPTPFEVCEFKIGKVNINYHLEVARHHYSVPHEYVQKEVEARYTTHTVEILFKGVRIASHRRCFKVGHFTTIDEHMPPAHQAHVKWTSDRMIAWVGRAGPSTAKLAEQILSSRQHPQQAFTSVLGLIRLGDKYGDDRLEQACLRALTFNAPYYRSVKNILVAGIDQQPPAEKASEEKPIVHSNIRGPDYYN